MHITNLAFLDYLCSIAGFQEFIIYHISIPRITSTITYFFDLPEKLKRERKSGERAYRYLIALPNTLGFQFSLVPFMSSPLVWIDIDQDTFLPPFYGIPILGATTDSCITTPRTTVNSALGKRECIYFHGRPSASVNTCHRIWSYTLYLMRKVDVL